MDNRVVSGFEGKLETDWGLSVLVDLGKSHIIFDTASSWEKLEKALKTLDIDLRRIKQVVISHLHWDHVGGLEGLVSALNREGIVPKIWLPDEVDDSLRRSLGSAEIIVNRYTSPYEIVERVLLLPPLVSQWTYPGIREQALFLEGRERKVLIVGCSHPSVSQLVQEAVDFNLKPDLVIGGSHLKAMNQEALEILRRTLELGVKELGLTHCTSDEVIAYLKDKGLHLESYAGFCLDLS